MGEILGIVLLAITIIISLPIVGIMFLFAVLWFMDWRQRKFFDKEDQNGKGR